VYFGTVLPGRNQTFVTVERTSDELLGVTGECLFPGSLNIVLDTPLRLTRETKRTFNGRQGFLWQARFKRARTWIYRWPGTPLQVVEILSQLHLRSKCSFSDGTQLRPEIERTHIASVTALGYLGCIIIWLERTDLFYQSNRYRRLAMPASVAFKASQSRSKTVREDLFLGLSRR
jgi:hypothetical protein